MVVSGNMPQISLILQGICLRRCVYQAGWGELKRGEELGVISARLSLENR